MQPLTRTTARFVALATCLLPLTHGLGALARAAVPGPPAALALSIATVVVALAAAFLVPRTRAGLPLLAVGVVGALLFHFAFDALGSGLALLAAAPLAALGGAWFERLASDDAALPGTGRPAVAALWMALGFACVAQTARIATFMADDSFEHGPTIAGFWDHHMCLPAYLQAAELNRAGDANVYHAHHYPGITRDAQPTTTVAGMEHYLEDPYQYPPQFLLLPHALVASGLDFATLRTLWFAGQALLFLGAAFSLARFVGGKRGAFAFAWMPLVWIAPVTMFNFQYGQAHLAVIAIAVLAMLAFEARRDALGGGLLAIAALSKLFPALLLIPLVVQRRYRALAWTAAAGIVVTGLSLAVLGTAPFSAFFEYHLPRLTSGEAFAFQDAWPGVALDLIASNQSVAGLVDKLGLLGLLGVEVATVVERALGLGYLLLSVALVASASRRLASTTDRAVLWLGALTLGSLASPGAWADYVLVSGVWMLAFLSAPFPRALAGRIAVAALWVALVLQPGVFPLVPVGAETGMLIASTIGYVVVLALLTWALGVRPRVEPARRPVARRAAEPATGMA